MKCVGVIDVFIKILVENLCGMNKRNIFKMIIKPN